MNIRSWPKKASAALFDTSVEPSSGSASKSNTMTNTMLSSAIIRTGIPVLGIPSRLPRKYYKNVEFQDEYGSYWSRTRSSPQDAEVVSSELVDELGGHAPALDIDVPMGVVPSSTPGHNHLYFDVRMPWRRYKRLLKAMAAAGLLEEGYVKASIRRRHTALRVPWIRKGPT